MSDVFQSLPIRNPERDLGTAVSSLPSVLRFRTWGGAWQTLFFGYSKAKDPGICRFNNRRSLLSCSI